MLNAESRRMKNCFSLRCHSRESGNPDPLMSEKTYHVYILASERNGTLYVGVTKHLERRVYEHQQCLVEGFTKKYGIHHLVYHEATNDIRAALQREKQIKKWDRKWKLELIEKENPEWRDLITGESC